MALASAVAAVGASLSRGVHHQVVGAKETRPLEPTHPAVEKALPTHPAVEEAVVARLGMAARP